MPGVVKFIEAKDIPGTNNYYIFGAHTDEVSQKRILDLCIRIQYLVSKIFNQIRFVQIFVSDKVKAAGSAVGLIIAESREIAAKAVKKVKVTYDNIRKPILTIADALKKAEEEGKLEECFIPEKGGADSISVGASKNTIKGEMEVGGQYHFQMETQITLCAPREDGMDVFSATQWMDLTQAVIASTLGVPNNT